MKQTLHVALLATATTFGYGAATVSQAPLIDLSQPAPLSQSTRGVVGFSSDTPVVPLPIKLTIKAWRQVQGESGKDLEVVVTLQNISGRPFEVPVSREDSAHRDGNKGRRSFLFLVRSGDSGRPRKPNVAVATNGSSSVPSSLVTLQPDQKIDVKLVVGLSRFAAPEGHKDLHLQLGCKEWKLRDDSYVVQNVSEEIWAAGIIELKE